MNKNERFALVRNTGADQAADIPPMRRYTFKNFTLNVQRRTLFNGAKAVRLNPKTFDLLALLVEKAGDVVTKEQILTDIWNESYVEEGNIAVHVSRLRNALGETKETPFIKTVSGNGYCFVAPVREMSEADEDDDDSLRFASIAVLPFANETGDGGLDYLSDGLTDGFINSLSRIPDLRVVTRHAAFRYRDRTDMIKEVGEELGIEAVLTGRVRTLNGKYSIGIELTECATESQVWGDHFWGEAEDVIKLQQSIVSRKADAIHEILRPADRSRGPAMQTHDIESHRMYLKGRFFFEKRSIQDVYKSILYFERSVSYDPANVSSYLGMIESYRLLFGLDELPFEEARNFILPVIDVVTGLDNSSDAVQTVLGGVTMYFDWNLEAAEDHLLAALADNPNNLDARCRYSDLLLSQRRFSDARREINNILLLDPISPATFKRVGKAFYRMEQYQTALHYLNEVLEMNPSDYEALAVAAAVHIEQGEYDSALEKLRESLRLEKSPDVASMVGYLYGRSGLVKEAKKEIQEFPKAFGDEHRLKLARIYSSMGRADEAFACLDDALDNHDVDLIGLNSDPRWAGISQDPRFAALLEEIGLTVRQRATAAN